MEGMEFPEFEITDLNGNHYSNESIKGKTTLFKTWFINCKTCGAEFPELNELVDKHFDNYEI
jgi:cytochrome oxidase Cu insertion factor (SCO1/SenC/PrrC family)